MTIYYLGNFSNANSGTVQYCEELTTWLRDEGFKVRVSSTSGNPVFRFFAQLIALVQCSLGGSLVIMDCFGGKAFLSVAVLARFAAILRVKSVLLLHGGSLPEYAAAHGKRVKNALAMAESVIAPSGYLQERMLEYRTDIRIIPNAIDLRLYENDDAPAVQWTILWLRAFHAVYHPVLAVQAVEKLAKRGRRISMCMAGPDKGDGTLAMVEEEIERAELKNQVEITGKIDKKKISRMLRSAYLYINTTNVDNTPVTILEAMACGVPVISTNVGGIPWLIEHGVNGILVPPDDAHALADAIEDLLVNPAKARLLVQNARSLVHRFDWTRVVPQWCGLLSEIADASAGSETIR